MRKIPNIEIHSWTIPSVMSYGVNRQFLKLRNDNIEYDKFLTELALYLSKEEKEELRHIYDTLTYAGTYLDIIKDVIPYINLLFNAGLSSKQAYKKIKEEGLKKENL